MRTAMPCTLQIALNRLIWTFLQLQQQTFLLRNPFKCFTKNMRFPFLLLNHLVNICKCKKTHFHLCFKKIACGDWHLAAANTGWALGWTWAGIFLFTQFQISVCCRLWSKMKKHQSYVSSSYTPPCCASHL